MIDQQKGLSYEQLKKEIADGNIPIEQVHEVKKKNFLQKKKKN